MTPPFDIQIIQATSTDDIEAVKNLFLGYLTFIEDYLGQSLDFQGTDKEFSNSPLSYDALFLAKSGETALAACGVKPLKPSICELKRLYCIPKGRGQSLGLKLTQAAMEYAKANGYDEMYLDTDHGLTHANQLYEKLGFKDIEKYYDTPIESRFMARNLHGAS